MPTAAGMVTAAIAAVLIVAARIFGIFELYIVAAAMAGLVACALLWVLVNRRALVVRRAVAPARLHAGQTSTVTLHLENNRIVSTPVARITDEVQGETRADANIPPVRRRSGTRASYRVETDRRGILPIGPMHTMISDPFGLARTKRTAAADTSLLVLPHVDTIVAPPLPGGRLAPRPDRTPSRIGLTGDEFSSLREYNVGDDLRKVNWAATARTGDLMVRTEEVPEHGMSCVLLDTRRRAASPDVFEAMVSAAASVLAACFERGDDVTLATTDGDRYDATDRPKFDRVLDRLAVIDQTSEHEPRIAGTVIGPNTSTAVMIVGEDQGALLAKLARSERSTHITVDFSDARHLSGPAAGAHGPIVVPVSATSPFAASWTTAMKGAR